MAFQSFSRAESSPRCFWCLINCGAALFSPSWSYSPLRSSRQWGEFPFKQPLVVLGCHFFSFLHFIFVRRASLLTRKLNEALTFFSPDSGSVFLVSFPLLVIAAARGWHEFFPSLCLRAASGAGRLHLCFLRRGNDHQDGGAGDFRLQLLSWRQVEPTRLCHRHGRVGVVPKTRGSYFLHWGSKKI